MYLNSYRYMGVVIKRREHRQKKEKEKKGKKKITMEEESAGQGTTGVVGIRIDGDEPPNSNLSEDVLDFVHNDSSLAS